MRRLLSIAAAVVACAAAMPALVPAAAEDEVHIVTRVSYDVRPDQGPVRITWEVTFQNNDPQTSSAGNGGTVFFYENVTIPVLRGASVLSAISSSGDPLDVTLSEAGNGPLMAASVTFDEPVFFGETYGLTVAYELVNVRVPSLLVTPTYVYLPVIGGGDESTVTVTSPPGAPWSVSLEAGECAQNGATFTCSGADAAFLAALLEVSRPDAITTLAFEVPVKERTVSVSLSYFQGEDAAAQHLKDLATAALPLLEGLYGFPYPGADAVSVNQGGRQAVLGYEGLTSCAPLGECSVVVSPVADDVTVVHELAHLWSSIYAKRWLSEGFAQLLAEEAASAMAGLIQSQPPEREPAAVDLRLDEWGEVSSLIGAQESEREIENAGYDRSLRFLQQLRFVAGSDVLRRVNAAIAASGTPADSRRYLDLLEEVGQKRMDDLFAEWVFPASVRPVLAIRREARDRLEQLARRVADEGLSEDVPDAIREDVEAWRFDAALAALDDAESELLEYEELKSDLSELKADSEARGLSLPPAIHEAMKEWDFGKARGMIREAESALEAYGRARERVDSPRSIWERFGLIGENPGKELERAANAFESGDFEEAGDRANGAIEMIDGASATAFRRLLALAVVLAVIAAGIGVAVWFPQRRDKDLAEL